MLAGPPDVEVDDELELLDEELEELLDDDVVLVLLDDELLDDEPLDEELDDDELLLDELLELLDDELLLLDEDELVLPPLGIEHSFTPPGTLVPAPNVTSPQTKLPLNTMKVNWSARPYATLVLAATEHVCDSLQIVT